MGNLNFWFFLGGAVIACRALSFAVIQWEMLGLRKSMTIERIINEQKACDTLIGTYHTLMSFVGIWMMIMGGWQIFHNVVPPQTVTIVTPIILLIAFTGYMVMRMYFSLGYDLSGFFEDMVNYRSKQEVVTKDNDNEVTFIRSYKRVKKHLWYSLFWMTFLVVVAVLCKEFLYVIY